LGLKLNSILALQEKIKRSRIDAILFNTSEITPSINLRYLTGFTGSNAALIITAHERHFITDGRYTLQAGQQTSGLQIHIDKNKLTAITRIIRQNKITKLAIEGPRISYQFASALIEKTNLTLRSLDAIFLENFRIKKNEFERAEISKAAQIASESCKEVVKAGLCDKTEAEIANHLESLFRSKGASGIAFETIVASGARAALPHGMATDKIVEKGDLVIIDYGCTLPSGYRSDETVTCKIGKPTKEDVRITDAVKQAHDKALVAAKPGIKIKDLDRLARDELRKHDLAKYFTHSLGHGLGLETHEPPYLSPKGRGVLQAGMVVTIEPGVYIEGWGGVRLESLVYIGQSGPEILSLMNKKLLQAK
jgi:Xaa-Pro aminopeptidase